MKRTTCVWMIFISMFFLVGWDEHSYTAEQVVIRAYILENGDLYVEEFFTYDFKGKFNKTERAVKEDGHEGVEFFEAYLIPPYLKKKEDFSTKGLTQLKTEESLGTHQVHFKAKDEKRQVHYRYLLKNAITKHKDISEFSWDFFDTNNRTDLNDVTIDIITPESFAKDQVHYFLHDRHHGRITAFDYFIRYENKHIPERSSVDIRFLFPKEFLPKVKPAEGSQDQTESILAEEQRLKQRYAARNEWMAEGETAGITLSILLLVVILFFSGLFILSRLIKIKGRHFTQADWERLDPLFVAYMHRRGQLQPGDYTAGLFSLYQRGIVDIKKIPSRPEYREDPTAPTETFQFLLTGKTDDLTDHERFLIEWLFDREYSSFTLQSITDPPQDKWEKPLNYHDKITEFKGNFRLWEKKVSREEGFSSYYRESKSLKHVIRSLLAIHFTMIMYFYYIDVSPNINLVIAGGVLGLLGLGSAMKYRKKRYFILFAIASFVALSQLKGSNDDAVSVYVVCLVLSMILVWIVPVFSPTFKGAPYAFAINRMKKRLKKGKYPVEKDGKQLERLLQYALVLEVADSFVRHYGERTKDNGRETSLPLAESPAATVSSFTYTLSLLDPPEQS